MSGPADEDSPFPAEDQLFAETFSLNSVYKFMGQELRIEQVYGSRLGVAASVWEAALQLCAYLEAVELRGQQVLELGAGTGVVGILAARLGAVVTLTDLPAALPQLQANVSANMPHGGWPSVPPTVLPLSWGENHTSFPSDWDLVLCADIVYLPHTFPLLITTLSHLCRNGAVAYLSSKMRNEHGTAEFFGEWLPSRFKVELVHCDNKQNINIYRACHKREQ